MLEEMRKTISMSKFAKNPESVARDIDASGAVYSIQRRGRPAVLMMDEEYYEGWRIVIEMMQRPDWREELEEWRRDAAEGRGRDLEEIAKELGLDRPAESTRRGAPRRAPSASRSKGVPSASRTRRRSA